MLFYYSRMEINMLNRCFYLLLSMSITASIIGMLIIMLRFIKRIHKFVIYSLWSLVFLRLLIPFSFSSEISLFNLIKTHIKVITLPTPSTQNIDVTLLNSIGAANSYSPIIYKTNTLKNIFNTASFIWFLGVVLTLLFILILYYFSIAEFNKATHFKDNIYINDRIQSPIVFGIFKAKIILPANLTNNEIELNHVLLHENAHIKRHDNCYRLIAIVIACVHWFNPFVWIFLKLFFYDMEASCDAKAIKFMSKNERKNYAKTLVNIGAGKNIFISSAFGQTNIKSRVINVLDYKKLTTFGTILSILFIFVLGLLLLTNPVK